MNLIGEKLEVLTSSDPGKVGKSGIVVLDTAKTIVIDTGNGNLMLEKAGATFQLSGTRKVVLGNDILGRLEDRWGSGSR